MATGTPAARRADRHRVRPAARSPPPSIRTPGARRYPHYCHRSVSLHAPWAPLAAIWAPIVGGCLPRSVAAPTANARTHRRPPANAAKRRPPFPSPVWWAAMRCVALRCV